MTRAGVLAIAGSDSGGGAGIQADLKTFSAYGVHGMTAITAITAQNSRGVTAVLALPAAIVEAQIDAVMSDLHPGVVKIGMLANAELIHAVAGRLRHWMPEQVVLDPVMIASSGDSLLEESAIEALRRELLPLCTLLTPNWPEAAALIDAYPRGLHDIPRIIASLQKLGVSRALIKGGHLEGSEVIDTLFDGSQYHEFRHDRIAGAEGHGTGCTLASAVAAGLALGRDLASACDEATGFVHEALRRRYDTGGSRPVFLDLAGRETS